jgi:hypothetical protein
MHDPNPCAGYRLAGAVALAENSAQQRAKLAGPLMAPAQCLLIYKGNLSGPRFALTQLEGV